MMRVRKGFYITPRSFGLALGAAFLPTAWCFAVRAGIWVAWMHVSRASSGEGRER